MKNIRLRKDGRWEARKYLNGHSYNVIAKTQAQCLKKYKELLKELKNNEQTLQTNIKFTDYGLQWADLYKKNFVGTKTYTDIKRTFEKIKDTKINIEVKKLTTKILQEYLNTLPNNRAKEIIILYLNACLKKAIKDKIILTNPMEDVIKAPKLKNIRKPFTYQEQINILKKLENNEIKPYILIYLFTGIRKNEFDINNIKKSIQEDNTLKVKCEKKRSQQDIYRFIDISEKVKNLILNNNFNLNTEVVSDRFRNILDDLKIPKGYGLHSLRHTFTTNHFYLNTPDKYVQEWLGHEDINVTKRHYTAIDRTLSKEKILNLYPNYYYIVKH